MAWAMASKLARQYTSGTSSHWLVLQVQSRVLRGPRTWLSKRLNPKGYPLGHPKRPYWSWLLECPWCLSVWAGLPLVGGLLWDATRAWVLALLLVLTLSLLTVVIDRLVDKFTPDPPAPAPPAPPPPAPAPPHVQAAFDQLTGDETDGTS